MSSPTLRKQSTSPIRNLQQKSPRKNTRLHTILEEPAYLNRPSFLPPHILDRENTALNVENRVLNDKIKNYAEETTKFLIQNSRLKQQNQILKDKNIYPSVVEVERLHRQIILKDAQIEKLRSDMSLLKSHYDRSLDHVKVENQGLKSQLVALENKRFAETQDIKQKYNKIAQDDITLLRKGYLDDMNRLTSNLEATKALLSEKELQIKHLTIHGQNLVQQHSIYLEQLISDNNILRNRILQIEIKKENEVKDAENKRQLQKSRTHGILTFCKQNTAFIEKQINRLAQELLQKSISIQQFTKDMVKLKRNMEVNEKRYQDKLFKLQQDCDNKIYDKERDMAKLEKYYKQQISDMKKVQMELQQLLSTKENELDSLLRENQHNKIIIDTKNNQIEELKANIAKLHEDHSRQISKVMTDSRIKRKSLRNLSQSSSLRDLAADGNNSSIIKKIQRRDSMAGMAESPNGSSNQLYTVHQELITTSQMMNNHEDEDDIGMKDLVLHYQNAMQQLKNNKALQLNIANQTIQKLKLSLRQKQQEVLEILQRFSPLMEYKLNSSSLEEERKQKIEKHYKANVDILSVMLDKYSISSLHRKK